MIDIATNTRRTFTLADLGNRNISGRKTKVTLGHWAHDGHMLGAIPRTKNYARRIFHSVKTGLKPQGSTL